MSLSSVLWLVVFSFALVFFVALALFVNHRAPINNKELGLASLSTSSEGGAKTGRLLILHQDAFSDKGEPIILPGGIPAQPKYFYYLETEGGAAQELKFDDPPNPEAMLRRFSSGDQVEVRGNSLRKLSSAAETLATSAPSNNYQTLLILMNYLDRPFNYNSTYYQGMTDDQIRSALDNLLFSSTPGVKSVNNYYRDASAGAAGFSGLVTGPLTINASSGDCSALTIPNIKTMGNAVATVAGVDLAQYSKIVYSFPLTSCLPSVCAMADGIGNPAHVWAMKDCNSFETLTHELGHSLGLQHSNFVFPNGWEDEYADYSDLMGQNKGALNAPHRDELSWLPANRILTNPPDGTYTIYALDLDPTTVSGPQLVKISRPATSDYYYLSFRSATGLFSQTLLNGYPSLNNPVSASNDFHFMDPLLGLNIHTYPGPDQPGQNGVFTRLRRTLVDSTTFGDTSIGTTQAQLNSLNMPDTTSRFTDTSLGLLITQVGHNYQNKSVTITINHPGGDLVPPQVRIISPANYSSPINPISITATASDNSGAVSRVEFYATDSQYHTTLIGTASAAPFSVSWNPAMSQNGSRYTLRAKAYDAAGNSGVSPATEGVVWVSNSGLDLPAVTITEPAPNAWLAGTVTVTATTTTSASSTISAVNFFDIYHSDIYSGTIYRGDYEEQIGLAGAAPYSIAWNSDRASTYSFWTQKLEARAADNAGALGTSPPIPINLGSQTTITSPTNGATVSGLVAVTASVVPKAGTTVSYVDYWLNGGYWVRRTTSPYTYNWNSPDYANGNYTWVARATDSSGSVGASAPVTVTAQNAVPIAYPLTVDKSGTGSGTATSSPAGISCGPTCTTANANFNSGTTVTLSASPAAGSTFNGWSGDCGTTGSCTMNFAKLVTATFSALPPPTITVNPVTSISNKSAIINWTTNINTTGLVRYGLKANSLITTVTDPVTATTTHHLILPNLSANKIYYYQITATAGTQTVSTPTPTQLNFKTTR